MGFGKGTYLGGMKKLKWMALLPFLLAGATACDDFGLATDPNKEQGELRWILDRGALTKAGDPEIPDTNDFLLTIADAQGNVLYDGTYGDSPEYLRVDPGSYTVSVKSIAFTTPAFDRPQYGDEQVVLIPGGEQVSVTLRCILMNAGIRLHISPNFLSAFPDGVLFLKQDDTRLKYLYKEKRIAYFKADNASLILYNEGKGCDKNTKKAFECYNMAAQTGDFEARVNLAVCYLQGTGTEKDVAKGAEILKQAADEKSPLAQTLLGDLYERGVGVEKDENTAMHYYLLAAKQGEPIAKKKLESKRK